MDKIKPIVITKESITATDHEHRVISELIEHYRCRVHIRKKQCTVDELDDYCEKLAEMTDVKYLTLHGHPQIVKKYSFGGYHAHSSDGMSGSVLYSKSCHSMSEAKEAECDYLFLSPIFDSISKVGYRAAYDLANIESWLHGRTFGASVIALGGVNALNSYGAYQMGFNGIALLGSVWGDGDEIINYNNIFKNYLKTL